VGNEYKDQCVEQVLDMEDKELIDTVKHNLMRLGKYTLAISDEDAGLLDNQVRIALRIMCFDMLYQGDYLVNKHTQKELNEEAGKEILVSVFDVMKGEKNVE
jgi:hypothetical protein